MSFLEEFMLVISTVAMGLVVLLFGFGAPWYRTRAGSILFSIKVSLFLMFTLALLVDNHGPRILVDALRAITFPITMISSIGLLILMIRAQASRIQDKIAAILLGKKAPRRPVYQDIEDEELNTNKGETYERN